MKGKITYSLFHNSEKTEIGTFSVEAGEIKIKFEEYFTFSGGAKLTARRMIEAFLKKPDQFTIRYDEDSGIGVEFYA